jgi:hypothetical protein
LMRATPPMGLRRRAKLRSMQTRAASTKVASAWVEDVRIDGSEQWHAAKVANSGEIEAMSEGPFRARRSRGALV